MTDPALPIFVSYASYDNSSANPERRWLDRLLQFLRPLDLEGKVTIWADTALVPGANWRAQIGSAIEKAKVAILLVSPAFLASEFIRSQELPRLLRQANPPNEPTILDPENLSEGMLVLPILLRPCLIDFVSFEVMDGPSESRIAKLTDFQYVPRGSAMNGLSQFEQDRQLERIARRIVDVVGDQSALPAAAMALSQSDTNELTELLGRFLSDHSRWWFNALRIRNWGADQSSFGAIRHYSVSQLDEALQALAKRDRIQTKQGRRSTVYRANSDA